MAAAVFFVGRTGKMAKEASGLQRRKYGRRKHFENAGFRAPRDSLRLDAKGMPPTHAYSWTVVIPSTSRLDNHLVVRELHVFPALPPTIFSPRRRKFTGAILPCAMKRGTELNYLKYANSPEIGFVAATLGEREELRLLVKWDY